MVYEHELHAARQRLNTALADLDLTPAEVRFTQWIARWDLDTIDRFLSIVEKARAA